jgi:hypothetical protein
MIVLNFILALFLAYTSPSTPKVSESEAVVTCDTKKYKEDCTSKIPQGYTFLKSYSVDGKNGDQKQVSYSYIFSKNTSYLIILANSHAQNKGFLVELYDSNRRKLASSYLTASSGRAAKYYPALAYQCQATGIYHLVFKFEDTQDYCAGSVLAFKR